MSKNNIKDIDTLIDEISTDVDKMNNKDIKKNISKYNSNIKKIQECQQILSKTQKDIETIEEKSSNDLINDQQFITYLNELDDVKKQISNGYVIKIIPAIDLYTSSIEKINKCKKYLENQKIEINNID